MSKLDVRRLANASQTHQCGTSTASLRDGFDLGSMVKGTDYEQRTGQSNFAYARGIQFENRVLANHCSELLPLCQEHIDFGPNDNRVLNLRDGYPKTVAGMNARAARTHQIVRQVLEGQPGTPNIIIGAVISLNIAGRRRFFEIDVLAVNYAGVLRPIEIKSFPIVDGKARDAKSLGAALDQISLYLLFLRRLVHLLGGEINRVPLDAVLVTPFNTSRNLLMSVKPTERRVFQAAQRVEQVSRLASSLAPLPGEIDLIQISDQSRPEHERISNLEALTAHFGTHYTPDCQKACPLAKFCRRRAYDSGSVNLVGGTVQRQLPNISDLPRAYALAHGSTPTAAEQPVAEGLQRMARLYATLTTTHTTTEEIA